MDKDSMERLLDLKSVYFKYPLKQSEFNEREKNCPRGYDLDCFECSNLKFRVPVDLSHLINEKLPSRQECLIICSNLDEGAIKVTEEGDFAKLWYGPILLTSMYVPEYKSAIHGTSLENYPSIPYILDSFATGTVLKYYGSTN